METHDKKLDQADAVPLSSLITSPISELATLLLASYQYCYGMNAVKEISRGSNVMSVKCLNSLITAS